MKRYIILLINLGWFFFCAAQEDQSPIKSLPTAAELGSFGRSQVGLFTGTNQQSISLYELKTRNLSYPITLNYSSNGLKVDKVASIVGYDWTMSAMGVIIREVRGLPDDAVQFTPYPANLDPTHSITQEEYQNEMNFYRGWRFSGTDCEPDVFSYNFCGYTGQFYEDSPVSDTSKRISVPYQNLKIGRVYEDSIRIVDDKGIQYLFEKGEMIDMGKGGNTLISTTTYHLKQIVHPYGDKITFNYEILTAGKGIKGYYKNMYDNEFYVVYNGAESGCRTTYIPAYSAPAGNYSDSYMYYSHLTSIVATGSGRIEFQYANGRTDSSIEPRMTGFTVYDNANNAIKSVVLYHEFPFGNFSNSFVNQCTDGSIRYRMFLDSVAIRDNKNVKIQRYVFNYNNLNELPTRLSYAQDHWGYFNGQENQSLLPDMIPANIKAQYFPNLNVAGTPDSTRAKADRSAHWQYAQKGMLSKIIYPTGGYSEFEYEAHRTRSYPDKEYGGVRLKQVRHYSSTGQLASTNSYEYSGGLSGWDQNAIQYYSSRTVSKGNLCVGYYGFSTFTYYWLKSNTIYSLGLSGHYDVGYEKVSILQGTTTSNTGKEEHEFEVVPDSFDPERLYGSDNVTQPPYTNYGWKSGTKISEKYYVNKNGVYNVVKEIKYQYAEDARNSKVNYYPSIECTAFDYPPTDIGFPDNYFPFEDYFNVSRYSIISKWHYQSAKIENTYNDSGQLALTDTTRYYYNNSTHALITSTRKTTSLGKKLETKVRYPLDINMGDYSSMTRKYMLNYPIEETTSVNGNVTASKLTTYKINGSGYVPDKVYSLETATPLASSSFAAFNGTTKDTHYGQTPEYSFDSYDTSNGNPLKVLGKNGIYTYYIWAYNKTYPVAKIESSVNTTINITVDDARLKKTTVYADIQADVAYLKGLFNSYLTNKDYQVTIFTYKPLVGMTSQTDPAERTTYYEYDDFGRLKLTKDLAGNILKKYEYHYAGQN